jgi:hypothetical protein
VKFRPLGAELIHAGRQTDNNEANSVFWKF